MKVEMLRLKEIYYAYKLFLTRKQYIQKTNIANIILMDDVRMIVIKSEGDNLRINIIQFY